MLEHAGVKVLLHPTQRESYFGLSVSSEGGGPAVVVNTWDRISVERWIFTAAHELGHLVLHPHEYNRADTGESKAPEREADAFASEFLMPTTAFVREWDETRGHPLLTRVLKVKRIFRVSYKTVLFRLVESGRESKSVWAAFQAQHKAYFGATLKRAEEPRALEQSEFAWDWRRAGEPE
ncbi:MAG: ImmA/IrrE family metallo-endopeptidase, partial [Gammaproteobacteria bacterium]|nr:ImmA/IrrE family metallo-endopeptidase [Gammaproteobacteria bacterium]